MADSYYQIATTPKLYVSYPLWQYANGALDTYSLTNEEDDVLNIDENLIKLLQLNPSDIQTIPVPSTSNHLKYRLLPSYDNFTDLVETGINDFDFMCILGHNLASTGMQVYPTYYKDDGSQTIADQTTIVN